MKNFYDSIGKNAIVVFDNVEDYDFIQKHLPTSGSVKVIITSRHKNKNFSVV